MKKSASAGWIFCAALGACQSEPGPDKADPAAPAPAPAPSAPVAPGAPQAKPDAAAKAAPAPADAATLRTAYDDALKWIAAHQDPGGSWTAKDGEPTNEVGLTGLGLLALMSDGTSSLSTGPHAQSIARGVQWLTSHQSPDTGLIGRQMGHSFHYSHAIAALALCTAQQRSPSEQLQRSAQDALNYIARARNPYGAWRYDYPPTGDSDTSVTGWMVAALAAGKDAGLVVDTQAFAGATQWIDEATEPSSGRVGYNGPGTMSSRVTGINDQFPTDRHEAMTASGMLTRINAGQTPASHPVLNQQAELLIKRPPEYSPDGYSVDEYYWYFGSVATKKLGGKAWDKWRAAMEAALLGSQTREGEDKGSWKALGPWGYSGGTVFSTSLNALSLATML